jgi:hypothetical protein
VDSLGFIVHRGKRTHAPSKIPATRPRRSCARTLHAVRARELVWNGCVVQHMTVLAPAACRSCAVGRRRRRALRARDHRHERCRFRAAHGVSGATR